MTRVLWVNLRRSVAALVIFFLLAGLGYPLAETALAQGLFAHSANGSIGPNGSTLIGQRWTGPQWFHGRPDADNPSATGATNLGPRSRALVDQVRSEVRHWRALGVTPTPDLVTTSGSGVDPDISPADALAQAASVARARHVSVGFLRRLVARETHPAQWGFLGAPYLDVLQLNEALARGR